MESGSSTSTGATLSVRAGDLNRHSHLQWRVCSVESASKTLDEARARLIVKNRLSGSAGRASQWVDCDPSGL